LKAGTRILTSVLLFCASLTSANAPTQDAGTEIVQLLGVLGTSQCEFYRNGTWYSGSDAQAHLRKKYDYLRRKGLADTSEEFIDNVGTKSSVSGEAYQVKCGDSAPEPSAQWLTEQLQLMRSRQSGDGNR
jgi:hypothetical protein